MENIKNLRSRTITAFSWNLFEGISSQGVTFLIGIILARLLTPKDFGLIGIITAFIMVSNSIVDGGLSNALIRKLDANQKDYSTVFFANFSISILLYSLIYFFSDSLSLFFNEPKLKELIRYSSLVIVINALAIIHRTILITQLNFKKQAIISFISSLISGVIAVFLAYNNFGVWSLVYLTLIKQFFNTLLLWFLQSWRPAFLFSIQSFTELFDYGYKLLVANLINSIYANIYYVVIGKMFSPTSLGYYTRADGFQKPFSSNIALGIRRISFPVLSKLQFDNEQLKRKFKKFVKYAVLLSSSILFSLAAMAKPIILISIGEKWINAVFYTQLLCIPGALYPLQILNLNILNVKGYSNLNLKLEIIKKIILIPLVLFSAFYSIEILLYSFILFTFVEYFLNSYYTEKIIGYTFKNQLKDILPIILTSLVGFFVIFSITFFSIDIYITFLIQVILGSLYYLMVLRYSKIEEIIEIKLFLKSKVKKIR